MKNNLRKLPLIAPLLLIILSASLAHAADEWNPQRTWVFFVGLVNWQHADEFESFPAEIRKDGILLDSLKKQGVPQDHIVYLKDSEAKTAVVQTKFAEFLKRAAPGDWAIVYFEGHGYKDDNDIPYLATYDTGDKVKGWRFSSVPAAIEKNFRGSHAIVALDNCYSGAMVDEITKAKRRVAYAVLASSMASQESTQNWTFTESLISGFNGASYVDADRDGRISLHEMSSNIEQDMLFGEEQVATTAFIGGFDADTIVATAAHLTNPRIGERVEAYSVNDWYRGFIVDVKNNKFKIHYYGYEVDDDEWVTPRMMRVPRYTSPFKVGEKVEVEWKKDWYTAHILNIKGGSHYVSYDEYDRDENEWVPSKRIRKIK